VESKELIVKHYVHNTSARPGKQHADRTSGFMDYIRYYIRHIAFLPHFGYLKYADGTPKANTTVDIEIPLTNTLYYSLPNSTFRATAVTNSNGYFSYKCGSITEYFNKLGYSSVSLTSGIGTFSNSAFVGSLISSGRGQFICKLVAAAAQGLKIL